MPQIFLQVINMSISASYIVLAVLLLRVLLKKAPKWITVVLWGIVAVRLICPFSIESVLSLIPSAETVSPDIMLDQIPEINTGIPVINQVVNPIIGSSFTPDPGTSANPLQLWIPTFAVIWIVGMVALLIYTVVSYAKLRHKIGTAVLYKDHIYQSENVVSPFVLGIIKPKIYLPFHMNEKDIAHVVAHETAHIRRKDHLWKPLGFLLLTLHWFNPLLWLGYVLLCRDIELACDEKVIKELDHDARADYSEALLSCSVHRRMIAACPLAFGEAIVKDRVKSVLNYKKPAFWIIIAAIIACVAVAICFLTDPVKSPNEPDGTEPDGTESGETKYGETDPDQLTYEQRYLMELHPRFFGLDASEGLDVYVCQFAPEHYSFLLFEHSEDIPLSTYDLMHMSGIDTVSMRLILDTYDVTGEDVTVVPWQHPLSSYIGPHQIIPPDGNIDTVRAEYKEKILDMLFGEVQSPPPTYDSMQFDVDGDGKIEHCILGFGPTSGAFTFTFSASEVKVGEWKRKYYNVIYSKWYKLSFVKCDDGIVRVQGIDQNDTVHLFDISIVDGNVHLTENGIPIGTVLNQKELVYHDPSLSWILSEVPTVTIRDGVLYELESVTQHTKLGTVTETTADQQAFKNLKEAYRAEYAELVNGLLDQNDKIYLVDPEDKEGVTLYYVMIQKDGSTVLVYGHYENGAPTDFIRWIFRIRAE